MSILDRVNKAITEAMKARDHTRLAPLRMLKAALMNRKVEKRRELTDEEEAQVVSMLVKQRRDSIEQFSAAGRQDLAQKETAEIPLLEEYLPPPVDASLIERLIEEAIVETGASSPKDAGKVMKSVMQELAGQTVDGKAVSDRVRARLAST